MASRNGPCSPSHNPPAKKISSIEQSENANINSNSGYMEYFVTIGVGTPKAEFNMLVDTGSDNTWVLCKPCTTATGCAPNAHLFDPSKSSTYVKGSPDFHSFYGDKSYVSGVWGYDTLTVDKSHVVKKFQLGCGQNIHNTNFGNAAAGILGLGQGKGSLPSQGGSKFKTFSYCLPKSDSQVGYLVFGEEAHKKSSSSKPKFTPLLPPPNKLPKNYQGFGKSYYFVELIGISVAGKQLNVDPSVFASPGTIIDSGTSITQLPSKAYSALATAFNQSMASKYPAAQSKQKPKLDTCYNVDGFNSSQVSVPDVTLRFRGGVDVSLRPSGIIIIPPNETNLVCLGFTQIQPHDDQITIIGNHQQRQIGMFFDLQGKRVGFGNTNCAD
nr:aspartyl protease family protein At5g10770-like [Ipomoea batatas]